MSEPTSAPVPYEQPAIVRRDSIKGLLTNVGQLSDAKHDV